MIKKFCTKHGIEYLGECPECACDAEPKVETKTESAPNKKALKPKRKNKPKGRDVYTGSYDEKLKALMDKWNHKN